MKKNNICLDVKKSNELVDMLNDLLANYQAFYQNIRGFHWIVKGEEFLELHSIFEKYYEDAVVKTDEIAERISTLHGVPFHCFEDYIKQSKIESIKKNRVGNESITTVIKNYSLLIEKERAILAKAGDSDDKGTVSQMSNYITETEKNLWMLNAYLG